MKELARGYCTWTNIDRDIENKVQTCQRCCDTRYNPPRTAIHPWERPHTPWERVHVDFAGPYLNHYFLIVMDAYSKWLEIVIFKSPPTSKMTIAALEDIFSHFGLCQVLVSDNGSQFGSHEFRDWCKHYGILQRFTAGYHPSSNGQAERFVQFVKRKLRAMKDDSGTLVDKVRCILHRQRITPHSETRKSPSELFFNRQIRSPLDLIRLAQLPRKEPSEQQIFQLGERAQVRNYNNRAQLWSYGKVHRGLGSVHYLVEMDGGGIWKRHVNQMRKCSIRSP